MAQHIRYPASASDPVLTGDKEVTGNLTVDGYTISGSVYVDYVSPKTGNTPLSLSGQPTDGAAAVGVRLASLGALATAGAKVVSIANASTEVASVDKDGNFEVAPAGGAVFLKSPNGTRYKLTVTNAGAVLVTAAP